MITTHLFDLADFEWVKKWLCLRTICSWQSCPCTIINTNCRCSTVQKKNCITSSPHINLLFPLFLSLLPAIVCLLNDPHLKILAFIYMSLHLIPKAFLNFSSYSSSPLLHSFYTCFLPVLNFFGRYMLEHYLYAIFVLPFLRHGSDEFPSSVTTIGSTFRLL